MIPKYLAEFGLVMCTSGVWVLQQEQLDDLADIDAHIYLVCRHPRVSIDPNSFSVSKTKMSVAFHRHRPGGFERFVVEIVNVFQTINVKLVSSYPHTTFRLESIDGRVIGGKAALVAAQMQLFPFDPEVLYVGQSFGAAGERNVVDRLKTHPTLQRIYAAAQLEAPDQETWLVLARFDENQLTVINGALPSQMSRQQNEDHIRQVLENPVTEKQKIAFTEAALIRYFQPRYNEKYREKFPSPEHLTYRECYALDLNLVAAEIQTFDIPMRLWSDAVRPSLFHIASFPLHSAVERRALFDFVGPHLKSQRPVWRIRKSRRTGYDLGTEKGIKVGHAYTKAEARASIRIRRR